MSGAPDRREQRESSKHICEPPWGQDLSATPGLICSPNKVHLMLGPVYFLLSSIFEVQHVNLIDTEDEFGA